MTSIFFRVGVFIAATLVHYFSLRLEADHKWYTRKFGVRGFSAHMWFTGAVWILLTIFLMLPNSGDKPLSFSFVGEQFIGNILIYGGLLIVIWSFALLGFKRAFGLRFFRSEDAGVAINRGPYRFLRNPIYDGFFLVFLGSAFTGNSLGNLILAGTSFICLNIFLAAFENRGF